MDSNVFVGRQPIFNRKGNIYAYELLYGSGMDNKFPDVAPKKATLELLVNTFLNIDYNDVANRTKTFINFSEKLLYENVMSQLDPRLVVIEVLEDVEVTSVLLKQLKRLKTKGFTITLDDFMIDKETFLYNELYKTVHIIKVDFQYTSKTKKDKIEVLPMQTGADCKNV